MKPRRIVYSILEEFSKFQGNLDFIIADHMKNVADHRDRRFIYELILGIFRHRSSLDYTIFHFMESEALRNNIDLINILRIGAYQIYHMDRVPDHAAVNESVKLSKCFPSTRKFSGLVNALLRNLIGARKSPPLPDQGDLPGRLAVEYSQPLWIVQRWLSRYGLQRTKKLCVFFNEKPAVFLRRKIRGLSKVQFEQEIRGFATPAPGYRNLYYKINKGKSVQDISLVAEGQGIIQSPSSGWVVAVLDIQKGDHVLDLCAAPGGKASLIAELAENSGSVCACDINPFRLRSVMEIKNRMKLPGLFSLCCDGCEIPVTGYFDKVLIDAPCSGTGVLHRHPDARWRKTAGSPAEMAAIQTALLESAAAMVPENGTLVYSTCSLEPEENEKVVENFLQKNPDYMLDSCPPAIPGTFTDLDGYLRILPCEHTIDGMFAARIVRKKITPARPGKCSND
ncbi:MAG: 16S rRNA (cytosine(967)-C(5))-methyltransferase RsmB [Chitinivibrionales bacterium]|nr:16S rRNA (cytosine(967)-C(5))-methyltransferase RsmB [Chitinivibrionales bacterium]